MKYTVKKGDTMSGIANRYGIPLDELIKANPQISNPDMIMPGQVIEIPVKGAPGGGAPQPKYPPGMPPGKPPGYMPPVPPGLPPGMPPGGMMPGMPPGGMMPGMPPGGMMPGMPPGGMMPGMPPGGMMPGMPPGGMMPGMPPGGMMPGMPPGGMIPGMPPGGMMPGCPGGTMPGYPGGIKPGYPGWAMPGMPPGGMIPGYQGGKFYDASAEVNGVKRGDTGEHIKYLQQRLKEMGYYRGSLTGHYGLKTRHAVMKFQQDCNMQPTGIADRHVWASIG